MNKELAKYILSLPHDLSVRVWLKVFSDMRRNGTSTLIKRDALIEFRITDEEFNKYFQPREAEKLQLIKVLAEGETFISINFKMKAPPVKLEPKQEKEERKALILKNPEVPPGQAKSSKNATLNEHGLIVSQISADFTMTEKCKRYIIGDYCEFFKKLQVNKSFLAGAPLVNPINPKIQDKEVRQLKDIARYFVSVGFDTEMKIIIAFQRMYGQWENLSERLQKMSSPGGIYACLNDIIQELSQLNNKKNTPPKPTPKDEQLNSKIDAAKRKDNSHLAKS